MASLEEARAAKNKAKDRFDGLNVNGIGIQRVGQGFGIKVTLVDEDRDAEDLDGVPVTFVRGEAVRKR